MEEKKFPHTARIVSEGVRRIKAPGSKNELQERIWASAQNAESVDTPFELAIEYLTDNFGRQADGLRGLKVLNDKTERERRSIPLLLRRKEMLNSTHSAIESVAFTDLEAQQLRWVYDVGCAYVNYISKNMGLFDVQYALKAEQGAVLSNVTTAETQQHLAQLLVTQAREASDAAAGEPRGNSRFIEEKIFPLFNTMAVRAMGLEAGTRLSNTFQNGVYGLAAAFLMYNDAKLNKFGKSFKVFFPSPYLDALEQTDLLLVDDESIPQQVREEIMAALARGVEAEPEAINKLSTQAKKFVYKIQVKTRYNGSDQLTAEDKTERDRFLSARCKSKGFDNGDYVVLTSKSAHDIILRARKELDHDNA